MYCATPKKHMPHTSQLKHIYNVFDRITGVRIKSMKLPRATSFADLVVAACFSMSILMDSVGRLLNAAAFSRMTTVSSTRPIVNSHRGDS